MSTSRTRAWVVLLILVAAGAAAWFFLRRDEDPDAPPPPPAHVAVASGNYALLVGCTEYPGLKSFTDPAIYESHVRLLGPGNDVRAMESALRLYLGVPAANIQVLTGWPDDAAARPTRANVLGQLERLTREVPRGARVLFLFAGHGSQQPDTPGGDEADGWDEILLPADAGKWDPEKHGLANVITDDEIGAHLLALRDAGAEVFAVFDCCHSGTITRGSMDDGKARPDVGPVRSRELSPEFLGIPGSATGGPVARGGLEKVGGVLPSRDGSTAGLAVISAARSWEQAPEMGLPLGRPERQREAHGLCSFQVVRALQYYGGRLTIGEIFAHVRAAYASMPWSDATPVAEGDLSLRVTSASDGGASVLVVRRDAGRLVVDAGGLRGLTVGSVLEVFRPGGFGDAGASLGRLAITEVDALFSVCGAVSGGPDPTGIPDGSPCRIVEVAAGGPPLRIALLETEPGPPSRAAARRTEIAALLDARIRSQFPFVSPSEADWSLRELLPQAGAATRFALGPSDPSLGVEPLEVVAADLGATLARVRRAQSLRAWGGGDARFRLPEGVRVEASLRRLGSDATIAWSADVALLPGDSILLRVVNGTGKDIDVAVKCLDATQTESPVWPQGEPSRRLTAGEKAPVDVDELQVADDGIGRESLFVVAAVRAAGAGALDLGVLSGPALPTGDLTKRQGERALLDAVAPEGGKTRGLDDKPAESVGIHEVAWRTTWGRIGVPTVLFDGMVALNPPVVIGPGAAGGAAPPGRQATWRRARVIRGDETTADILLLSGDGRNEGEGATGILVDENGDARLDPADPAAAARRAAAGELPVELMVVLEPTESSAAYPRRVGDGALGLVRAAAPAPDRDRAARCFELGGGGWEAREACGPWLSTTFVPIGGPNADGARARIVKALRRFCRPR